MELELAECGVERIDRANSPEATPLDTPGKIKGGGRLDRRVSAASAVSPANSPLRERVSPDACSTPPHHGLYGHSRGSRQLDSGGAPGSVISEEDAPLLEEDFYDPKPAKAWVGVRSTFGPRNARGGWSAGSGAAQGGSGAAGERRRKRTTLVCCCQGVCSVWMAVVLAIYIVNKVERSKNARVRAKVIRFLRQATFVPVDTGFRLPWAATPTTVSPPLAAAAGGGVAVGADDAKATAAVAAVAAGSGDSLQCPLVYAVVGGESAARQHGLRLEPEELMLLATLVVRICKCACEFQLASEAPFALPGDGTATESGGGGGGGGRERSRRALLVGGPKTERAGLRGDRSWAAIFDCEDEVAGSGFSLAEDAGTLALLAKPRNPELPSSELPWEGFPELEAAAAFSADAAAAALWHKQQRQQRQHGRLLQVCEGPAPILDEMLRGANVVVEGDDGWFYGWFAGLADAYKRRSSHRSTGPTYGVPEGAVLKTLLTGTDSFRDTWFQLEGANWAPFTHPLDSVLHAINYVEYMLGGRQIGPLGSSRHVDSRPLRQVFDGCVDDDDATAAEAAPAAAAAAAKAEEDAAGGAGKEEEATGGQYDGGDGGDEGERQPEEGPQGADQGPAPAPKRAEGNLAPARPTEPQVGGGGGGSNDDGSVVLPPQERAGETKKPKAGGSGSRRAEANAQPLRLQLSSR
ncbi:unnamed protein product [Phaeothamnion confervicola]